MKSIGRITTAKQKPRSVERGKFLFMPSVAADFELGAAVLV